MVYRSFRLIGKYALLLAIIGVLLFLSNPLQENFEIGAMRNSAHPETWRRPSIFLLLEEGSELFASYCLLLAFTISLKSSLKTQRPQSGAFPTLNLPTRNTLYVEYLITILLMAVLMVCVKLYLPLPEYKGSGIAQNWFPSALCFFGFVVAMYFYFISKAATFNPRLYCWAAFVSLGMSVFFGANLYESPDRVYRVITIIMVAATFATAGFIALKVKNTALKFTLMFAAGLALGGFFAPANSLPVLGYFIFVLMIFSMTANVLNQPGEFITT